MVGEDNTHPRYAPWYQIPSRRIVAVEHPGIVKNVDRAIATLQGEKGLANILDPFKPAARGLLFLRPEDPMARPIESVNRPSNNVLLKVTVPKWTGRKRKRGSDEPFTNSNSTPEATERERNSSAFRQQSLRDNATKYTVEPVGTVERTHNYRSIPDYVFSTTASPFTQRFRETIFTSDYEKMRQFDMSMSKGELTNVDLIPPPAFSKAHIPFQYTYRQNPTVKVFQDTAGNVNSINTQTPNKVRTHQVIFDVPKVPSQPHKECPPVSELDKDLQETIAILETLFAERPAWTRRGLRNSLKTPEQRTALRHAVGYVGYIFRSGPWRDAIIKLGCDPRTDVEFRKFQTFVFRVQAREPDVARDGGGSAKRHSGVASTGPRDFSGLDISGIPTVTREELPDSHLWTGKAPLPLDGKIWMVCDIVDPIIKELLYPTNPAPDFLRRECDPVSDGWYGSGTLAKVKTIMRQKINALTQQHREPADSEYECILGFPDHAPDDPSLEAFYVNPETATPRELMLATEVRTTLKGAANWTRAVSAGRPSNTVAEGEEEERDAIRRVMEENEPMSEDNDDVDDDEDDNAEIDEDEEMREADQDMENDEDANEDDEARAQTAKAKSRGKGKQKRVRIED
ncbi:General transcription factor 3C polypeptide 5 [Talaromyces islandicus]|uniref:General transcription factor 3C polypeptide 5 n=1 Tax=Talaromyces islandicus TaxID=28573 RepID=A0A0U1LWC6_TALIS|nr:General transcription factor 3C polypeptide 5 [Talaromyces islandicus]